MSNNSEQPKFVSAFIYLLGRGKNKNNVFMLNSLFLT